MTKYLKFLSGGGEMGALTRAYDWESSPIGSVDKWPQSLLTTLGILLNSKFPMFLFWGPDHVCFYNDAYRPTLGNEGKHPSILGMKGVEAWPEIWYIIQPMIDKVLSDGEATWSEDQLIPIYRNGKIEDVYWTFSYSPVKDESGLPAGVFVACAETNEKVNNLKKIAESNNQLNFAIEATQLGTWDYNPLTNKFISNNRFKDWFGIPNGEEFDFSIGMKMIVENDRSRVSKAIQRALQYESGGFYDNEYSIINPITKKERIVRAKGKAWFGEDKKAYRFNGTMQDITQEAIAMRKIEASEQRFRNLILQAPVLINTFIGPSFIVETINKTALEIWGKSYEEVINKPLFESSPEMEDSMKKILNDVYITGEPFIAHEIPVEMQRIGKPDMAYFNTVYQPLRDLDNKIDGIIVIGTEVTETVKARKQIEASEKRFSNILSQSIMAVGILKGTDMVITFANDPIIATWGKGRNIIGKPLFDVLPEITSQGFPELLQQVYTTGVPYYGYEVKTILIRNGKEEDVYYNFVYQPYTEVDDTITGITIIATEVTEQVLVKKQIEASEKRYSNILSQSIMSIAIFTGPEMILTFANKSMLTAWGKEEAILNKPLLEGIPEIKDQMFPKLLADVYKTGVPYEGIETKAILMRNGKATEIYFNFIYQVYRDFDNNIAGITVMANEVTEQVLAKKQIEESGQEQNKLASQLKLATDSAKVGIWSLNIDSSKLEWSNMHKIMWGYDEHRENLIYEDWYKVIVPEDAAMALKKVKEAKINHTIYDVEYRIKRANDGAIVWMKSTGQYQYDEFGVAQTLSGICIDISEQKRIDAELLEAKSKAETDKEIAVHAAIAKQQFLSNMSHEIRTPMNAIIGFTKILMKTDLTEKQKEYLGAIKSSGNTLIILINDILDLAKVDAGKMIFLNAPFKIAETITTILHLFETNIQEKNLELVKEYDSRIPEILLGDSVRLHQILINLLSNAIKFTTKGKIILSVTLLNEDQEKVTLDIKVTDTGIGIPSTKIATIFENFEQASSDTSSVYGGTGLGLAIVKQLVEKQGGTISVKSKVNEGSTFSFTLSFQKNQTNLDSYQEENEEVELVNEIKDLKVLVVEDVKLNQLLMRIILDNFKFKHDIADNGKIAIEKLQTNSYDIILMDLQMPIMNGFEATEHIRNKMNLQIPIIALTADVTTVDIEKCKAVGMNDHISKPLDEKLLYTKILNLIKAN